MSNYFMSSYTNEAGNQPHEQVTESLSMSKKYLWRDTYEEEKF